MNAEPIHVHTVSYNYMSLYGNVYSVLAAIPLVKAGTCMYGNIYSVLAAIRLVKASTSMDVCLYVSSLAGSFCAVCVTMSIRILIVIYWAN